MNKADIAPGTVFVEQGSSYNPGWHITQCKRERHFEVLSSFDTKDEAEAELPWYLENYS